MVTDQSTYFVETTLRKHAAEHVCTWRVRVNTRPNTLACVTCIYAEPRVYLQPLHPVFQLGFQLFKLLFKPALAGTHDPVMDEEDDTDESECTEKKWVTHA